MFCTSRSYAALYYSPGHGLIVVGIGTGKPELDCAVKLPGGALQTLEFQNGFLYAISDGELRTFAIDGGSVVQTSQSTAVSASLQTSLFTDQRLYLSDFHWNYGSGDESVLRVFDLSNPAYPRQASQDHSLPGGNSVLLPIGDSIWTIGSVIEFEGVTGNWLKQSLFSDPFAAEQSHLILGTDLQYISAPELADGSYHFSPGDARVFLPYVGTSVTDGTQHARVGVSHSASGQIVSEGAVELSQVPERVRPIPGRTNEVLSFAPDAIDWLTPAGAEWASQSVMAYFVPNAVYRASDDDVYVEVLRLGRRCKLHVTPVVAINDRSADKVSEEFDCANPGSGVRAYGRELVFGQIYADATQPTPVTGVSFDLTGAIRRLTTDEIAAIEAKIAERQVCILSRDVLQNTAVDFTKQPDLSHVECMSDQAYRALSDAAPSP